LLHVSVFDNGTGIVLSEKDHYHTFGIMSMKERAAMFNGQLRINRLKKGGTEVLLHIPVKHE
jgi:signal transduction histidine kinase